MTWQKKKIIIYKITTLNHLHHHILIITHHLFLCKNQKSDQSRSRSYRSPIQTPATQENVNPVQHSQPQIDLPLTKEISIEDYNMLQHVKEDQARARASLEETLAGYFQ